MPWVFSLLAFGEAEVPEWVRRGQHESLWISSLALAQLAGEGCWYSSAGAARFHISYKVTKLWKYLIFQLPLVV